MKERKADCNNNKSGFFFSFQVVEKVLIVLAGKLRSCLYSLLTFSDFSPDASLRLLAAHLLVIPYSTENLIPLPRHIYWIK